MDYPSRQVEYPVKQMSLFQVTFGHKVRRTEIGGVIHFSILDVFEHYGSEGSAKNPAMYWKRAKKRLNKQAGEVITGLLEHRFDGQGQRDTPYAAT
jgi:hypothetical protein